MNPDELDDLLSRSLRQSTAPSERASGSGALGEIVRRGRTRRRRRHAVTAALGAVGLVVVAGATVVARRVPDRQRVVVAAPSPSDAPSSNAPTSSTTVATFAAGSAASTSATAGPAVLVEPSFVAVRDATFELWTPSGKVRSFVPCPASDNGCAVPVVTVVGDQVWYVVSRGDGSTAVERVSVADDAAAQVVYEPTGGARVRDVTVVSVDDLYVIESVGGATRGTLIRLHGGAREVIAADVAEVVATPAGRLAYVTPDGVVVRETSDGATRNVPFGSMSSGREVVSQLSWAPTADALIFRAADRYLLDVAGATTLDAARPLGTSAACWISDSELGALQPSAASNSTSLAGTVIGIDRATLTATPFGSAQHRTEQIGCGDDGTVALVELAAGETTGDLVRLHADGSVERLGSSYTRVRSIR